MYRTLAAMVALAGLSVSGCRQAPTPAKPAPTVSPAVQVASPSETAPGSQLAISDVEKVLGVKGVQVVPRLSRPGAGGDLNFALPNGDLVLMVSVSPGDRTRFERTRAQYRVKDIGGVGEEAFYGPPGATQYLLAFRKGDQVVSINTFFAVDSGRVGDPMMTETQLTEIARLVASRM